MTAVEGGLGTLPIIGACSGFIFDKVRAVTEKSRAPMSSVLSIFSCNYRLASPATWGLAAVRKGMRHVVERKQERT